MSILNIVAALFRTLLNVLSTAPIMLGGKYLSQRFQIPGRSGKPEKIMRKTKKIKNHT